MILVPVQINGLCRALRSTNTATVAERNINFAGTILIYPGNIIRACPDTNETGSTDIRITGSSSFPIKASLDAELAFNVLFVIFSTAVVAFIVILAIFKY